MFAKRIRTAAVATATAGLLAALPVAGASAATAPAPAASAAPTAAAAPAPAGSLAPSGLLITFIPPRVGPLSVDIGPTIINGKVINAGLHVLMPGSTLPPIHWAPHH
jgi:hypothetical protein